MSEFSYFADGMSGLSGRQRAGDQVIRGVPGAPADADLLVFGDVESLTGRATGGDDIIERVASPAISLFGDAMLIADRALGGDDTLQGSAAVNLLHGDADEMLGRARGGDDVLVAAFDGGEEGPASTLYGDARRLADRAEGGDDTLSGSAGGGGVTLMFGDGRDLAGRSSGGDDRLSSRSAATDEMWGDAFSVGAEASTGGDIFAFAPGNGRDIIHDYEPGRDRIDLAAFGETVEQVAARLIAQADGTLITLDTGGSLGNSVLVAGAWELTVILAEGAYRLDARDGPIG